MSARTDRLDELAAITVEEWHHMRRICCLLPLMGRPMHTIAALTDERRQVAA